MPAYKFPSKPQSHYAVRRFEKFQPKPQHHSYTFSQYKSGFVGEKFSLNNPSVRRGYVDLGETIIQVRIIFIIH